MNHSIPELTPEEQQIVDDFHKLYYSKRDKLPVWKNTYFLGYQTLKYPQDLWIYQEILYENRPDIIIETGTRLGGSALYLALLCDVYQVGKIISVDIKNWGHLPNHPRITFLQGSSIDKEIISNIKSSISPADKVMVILDSDHSKEHVLQELAIYADLVTSGQYLIVEDSNVNGHPVYSEHGPGPMEAIAAFLQNNQYFKIDKSREKFWVTASPNGFLKKV